MKTLTIQPSKLKGSISIPPSKSHTLRALVFALMGSGTSEIHNPLPSPDTLSMIRAVEMLGGSVEQKGDTLIVTGTAGKLRSPDNVIDAGNSGQVLRFIGALTGFLTTYTVLTGDHSIRYSRPVKPLLDALSQLGAQAYGLNEGSHAPILIKGPIQPGFATFCGQDSQPVSAILIAASFLHGVTHLNITNPGEKPWIGLTLDWLKRLGGKISHEGFSRYVVHGSLSYDGFFYSVPGDFSSAAFPIVAALITGSELTIDNLDMNDAQGDKDIITVLQRLGADIKIDHANRRVIVHSGKILHGGTIDINDMIDTLPILAVAGCFVSTKMEITGAAIARKKESDRIASMTNELKKMGANIEETKDGLMVFPSSLHGAHVQSHRDHRIAMALSVAALAAQGETIVDDVGCIEKSYPSFISDFQQLGAKLS